MSAGLSVIWQVSFLNRFCWIWSSGVVINTLKFSWMKRTRDVSKVFSQIESLQVDIKSLKYRKESFCSIIHYDTSNPNFIYVTHENGVKLYCQVVLLSTWDRERSQIDTYQKPTPFEQDFCILKFWKCEVFFDNKNFIVSSAQFMKNPQRPWDSNPQPLYR